MPVINAASVGCLGQDQRSPIHQEFRCRPVGPIWKLHSS